MVMDGVVQVPNGFGCGLGTMQLILYFIYRNKGEPKKAEKSLDMELGMEKQSNSKPQNGTL